MINDNLILKGRLNIALNGKTVQEVDNLVVTVGKNFVPSRMAANSATVMSHMAIGSGTNNPAASDTTLQTELGRVSLTSGASSTNTVVYIATFAAGTGTGAVTEAGTLNASSGGTLLCRTEFSVVNKGSADSMTITWTITVS